MPDIQCPIASCTYSTGDVDAAIAAALLTVHNNVHLTPAPAPANPNPHRAPKIDRPKISCGSSEETWNAFTTRWGMFKRGTALTAGETVHQLFQCCDEDLGDAILNGIPNAVSGTEDELLTAMKQMAVVPVAICVRRADLMSCKQDHGESIRAYHAKVKGKATTCAYTIECTSGTCTQVIDFTDIMVKQVITAGLADEEIKKQVLGWADVDDKNVNDTVVFIEAKEMARDALNKQPVTAGLSLYKKSKTDAKLKSKIACKECHVEIERYVWNKRQGKTIECSLCLQCWKKANSRKVRGPRDSPRNDSMPKDETSALLVGAIANVPNTESAAVGSEKAPTPRIKMNEIILDHHIFHSKDGWKKSESMAHPTLRLRLTTEPEDYCHVGSDCPNVMPSYVTAVTDTGAQSCLWSLRDFYRCGFDDSDLLPVRRTMQAANSEEIEIAGAIFIRLSGPDSSGVTHTAPVMAYVSPSTQKFYLSRGALIQLGVISRDFPRIGAAADISGIETVKAPCGCPVRTLPPERPKQLPFKPVPENNEKMKTWFGVEFHSSTLNKCHHQLLNGVTGPDLKLHVDPNATPVAHHTPAPIPLNWQAAVKKQLDDDVALGVVEKVPHGQPSKWCHRMVVVWKGDGPRRTVDMSALNKASLRETHHVTPPFQQARSIPPDTWKTVTDAWNGYHSVRLWKEDRELTTFITPWGRYRYIMAPQGSLASGDGYCRRYDEILADFERKTKCVDDTAMWDTDLEAHWWRVIDFFEVCGRNGVVLNFEKFQFAQREIDFAGFHVTESDVKPLDKYLKAIMDFPTPTRTTDIRAWFGLVHQVSHYNKLTTMLEPFKPFLSPKVKFVWSENLNRAFERSKEEIINAIKSGVEIYDPNRRTCLRPDWSKQGIGYFLSQKHCDCDASTPGCCKNGWRITLAGSRFLKPAETRYAPIEGEALAIAWSLEHTRFFTQGCDNLVVITDHKPLVNLFGDKTLDQITNPRLFSLKQRTLPWRFKVDYKPGKDNHFSDATSRNPVLSEEDVDTEISGSEVLAGIMVDEAEYNESDYSLAALTTDSSKPFRAITWEIIKAETCRDIFMNNLVTLINSSFPQDRCEMPPELLAYWNVRNNLYVVDGVVMLKDRILIPPLLRKQVAEEYKNDHHSRIVIPPSLREEILVSLHSAHQGVTGMNERAKAGVFWPGITNDIQSVRDGCTSCNKIMPSQPRMPPVEPWIPSTPFEAVACDFFHYMGYYYFVAADRLSGWIEVQQIKVGTNEAGAEGLCRALRRLMVTFGVPTEISSDGGPEFTGGETKAFFKRWSIRHRTSSVSFPSSNGRAELAVKSAKRLLMDNIGPNGKLDNDKMVRALLTHRNTPDPGCKLSPAQILLGRPLRDTLPYISKEVMVFNNPEVLSQWKEAWEAKEHALKARYVKTLENLSEHSRPLPPLRHGDHVIIQNQHGRFPKKWDKSGIVVETKPNDQYVVKVAGTGRLTLRNRRFLRRYSPHFVQGPEWRFSVPEAVTNHIPAPPVSNSPRPNIVPHNTTPNRESPPRNVTPNDSRAGSADGSHTPTHNRSYAPQRLTFGDADAPAEAATDADAPPVRFVSTARPKRSTRPTQIYDASTGQYTSRSSVPDDI